MNLGVSYIAPHLPNHIETDMAHLADIGCNEVLFALQENHFKVLTGAVRHGARLAEKYQLKPLVVVWGFANTFGGGRMSHFLLEKPEIWRVDRQGKPVPKACLNNPAVVDIFEQITRTCRAHGFQGMFVDEPTPQDCFCTHCQTLFSARNGGKLKASTHASDYVQFQNDTVVRYSREVSDRVKAVDSALKTITCVMPVDQTCWEAVAQIKSLDVFSTDPYWLVENSKMSLEQAVEYARAATAICAKWRKESQIWLNAWKIPAGVEEEIYVGGKALAAVGFDSMYTWSFRGGWGTTEESARPDFVWAAVSKLYGELAARGC
jgi:hypothetical protein